MASRMIFILLILLTVFSCASYMTIATEYNERTPRRVLDSIQSSGTVVRDLGVTVFVLDNQELDSTQIMTLNKKGETTGSVQIRKVDSLFNIKIIDVITK